MFTGLEKKLYQQEYMLEYMRQRRAKQRKAKRADQIAKLKARIAKLEALLAELKKIDDAHRHWLKALFSEAEFNKLILCVDPDKSASQRTRAEMLIKVKEKLQYVVEPF